MLHQLLVLSNIRSYIDTRSAIAVLQCRTETLTYLTKVRFVKSIHSAVPDFHRYIVQIRPPEIHSKYRIQKGEANPIGNSYRNECESFSRYGHSDLSLIVSAEEHCFLANSPPRLPLFRFGGFELKGFVDVSFFMNSSH